LPDRVETGIVPAPVRATRGHRSGPALRCPNLSPCMLQERSRIP
jgi:hypothetical protein